MLKSMTLAIFLALASTSAHAFPFQSETIDCSSEEAFKQSFERIAENESKVDTTAILFGTIQMLYANLPPERRARLYEGGGPVDNPFLNVAQSLEYAYETDFHLSLSDVKEYVRENGLTEMAAQWIAEREAEEAKKE
ncbi:hypothetical protein GQF56_07170 [Rhodobacter sphaeroides]|jgi:hypothetical protein|uniref:Uncharacterized protein n=2 Tax=Cereibacter sphaeroides TaxID=1063 RepID=U5NRH5_CERS4|nr:hypothetical protein [Cereibacter sphaeroides]AGY32420.1 hypothetical protein RSP_7544 [Cereibacter sphaeroides 2.4.1]AXC61384.1 hypothetical protein DQL45_08415 [Cereibacter sphaeroides 2.4.1]MVX47652.1 hypothetical protein [Cereibacter sphaeroides]QHA13466.1 hypothetical protein GQY06_08395 [Cereibacter sphaeroides]QJC83665.1 hypothetical protein HGN32_05530 [Cereibacter sphaeroides]